MCSTPVCLSVTLDATVNVISCEWLHSPYTSSELVLSIKPAQNIVLNSPASKGSFKVKI